MPTVTLKVCGWLSEKLDKTGAYHKGLQALIAEGETMLNDARIGETE
jgi:hypothetical protein